MPRYDTIACCIPPVVLVGLPRLVVASLWWSTRGHTNVGVFKGCCSVITMVDHTKMRNVRGLKTLMQITRPGDGMWSERVRHIARTPRDAQALAHAHAHAHADVYA